MMYIKQEVSKKKNSIGSYKLTTQTRLLASEEERACLGGFFG